MKDSGPALQRSAVDADNVCGARNPLYVRTQHDASGSRIAIAAGGVVAPV
jgi:hypothetical protein